MKQSEDELFAAVSGVITGISMFVLEIVVLVTWRPDWLSQAPVQAGVTMVLIVVSGFVVSFIIALRWLKHRDAQRLANY